MCNGASLCAKIRDAAMMAYGAAIRDDDGDGRRRVQRRGQRPRPSVMSRTTGSEKATVKRLDCARVGLRAKGRWCVLGLRSGCFGRKGMRGSFGE